MNRWCRMERIARNVKRWKKKKEFTKISNDPKVTSRRMHLLSKSQIIQQVLVGALDKICGVSLPTPDRKDLLWIFLLRRWV